MTISYGTRLRVNRLLGRISYASYWYTLPRASFEAAMIGVERVEAGLIELAAAEPVAVRIVHGVAALDAAQQSTAIREMYDRAPLCGECGLGVVEGLGFHHHTCSRLDRVAAGLDDAPAVAVSRTRSRLEAIGHVQAFDLSEGGEV